MPIHPAPPFKFGNKIEQFTDLVNRHPYIGMLIIILVAFHRTLLGLEITGWDTFDVYTTNFIYMSDALKSGTLALYNPFVLSGTPIYPNLVTSTFMAPFDLVLLIISIVISPLYVIEYSIAFVGFLYFLGHYFLFIKLGISKKVSLITSAILFYVFVPPLAGQLGFIYGFTSAAWFFNLAIDDRPKSTFRKYTEGILLSILFVKGYPFYNALILLATAVIILIRLKRTRISAPRALKDALFYLVLPLTLFLILNLDAHLAFSRSYSDLMGDLVVQEPRIRQFQASQYYFLNSFWSAIRTVFSLKIGQTWTDGFLFLSPIIFWGLIQFYKSDEITTKIKIAISTALTVGLFFSVRSLASEYIWSKTPVLNSFRWCHANIYFVIYTLTIAFAITLELDKSVHTKRYLRTGATVGLIVYFLYSFSGNLISLNRDGVKDRANDRSLLKNRIEITQYELNNKKLGQTPNFEYRDISWLTQKRPITHGYNNTVHELYWRMKDFNFNSRIAFFPEQIRQTSKLKRSQYSSDNKYLDEKIKFIDPDGHTAHIESHWAGTPHGTATVDKLVLRPNTLKLRVTSDAVRPLLVTLQHHSSWTAKINGNLAPIARANLIFMSVDVPVGVSDVEFTFEPQSIKWLMLFYLILTLLFCLQLAAFLIRKLNIKNFKY